MRSIAFRFSLVALVLSLVAATPARGTPRAAPMIYDTIEQVAPVLVANYTADLTVLAGQKGVAVAPAPNGINATITLYKDLMAEVFATIEQNALPGLGVDWDRLLTHARRQDRRDNLSYLVVDYFARGTDPAVLNTQLKLAAETLVHRIDQIASTAGGGVYGAGEADHSIEIVKFPIGIGQDYHEGRFLIRFPVQEEDLGLT